MENKKNKAGVKETKKIGKFKFVSSVLLLSGVATFFIFSLFILVYPLVSFLSVVVSFLVSYSTLKTYEVTGSKIGISLWIGLGLTAINSIFFILFLTAIGGASFVEAALLLITDSVLSMMLLGVFLASTVLSWIALALWGGSKRGDTRVQRV